MPFEIYQNLSASKVPLDVKYTSEWRRTTTELRKTGWAGKPELQLSDGYFSIRIGGAALAEVFEELCRIPGIAQHIKPETLPGIIEAAELRAEFNKSEWDSCRKVEFAETSSLEN